VVGAGSAIDSMNIDAVIAVLGGRYGGAVG
jgi:hypothetical protein